MMKVQDLRGHADDCRRLARAGLREHREALLRMAETWDACADEAERASTGPPPQDELPPRR
jgi:hypothetical protein